MEFLFPSLNSIAAGVLILVIPYFISKRWWAVQTKTAPKAPGSWPILGHLPLLGGTQLPHITLGALADKYGPIFSLRLGTCPAIVVSSWEMARECFSTNDANVSERPKLLASKHLGYDYAMFGLAPYSPYWREMRKLTVRELLSNRRLELLQDVKVSEVKASLKEMYMFWNESKTHSGKALVELKRWFANLSVNVMLRIIVGKRFDHKAGDSSGDLAAQTSKFHKAVREFFDLLGAFVVSDFIPYTEWMDIGGYRKANKKTAKELDEIVGSWLEEHKRSRASAEAMENGDFMDVLLSTLDAKEYGSYDVDTVIKATITNMLVGGVDTSTVTLTWAVSLLLNNPHTLKKAQEEIDTQVGREKLVSVEDISKLVYLQAIVKEALRLYPAAPLSSPRVFSRDCVIGGYHVQEGTRLITNIWKIQTDARVWANPLKFQPERFLRAHRRVDLKGRNYEFIPFGSGRRMCPGMEFGLQMVHVTLASLLQVFDIEKPSEAPIDMTESSGLVNAKATAVEVLLAARSSLNLMEG